MSDAMEIDNTSAGAGKDSNEMGDDNNNNTNNTNDNTNTDTNKPKKKRFEIKKWTAVAFWSWDQSNDTCAICRNHLMEQCVECEGKLGDGHGDGNDKPKCPRAVGRCNHSFHLHCISTWIKTRNSCPLDNTDWAMKEILEN